MMKATPTHPRPESLPSLFRSDGLNRLSEARSVWPAFFSLERETAERDAKESSKRVLLL